MPEKWGFSVADEVWHEIEEEWCVILEIDREGQRAYVEFEDATCDWVHLVDLSDTP